MVIFTKPFTVESDLWRRDLSTAYIGGKWVPATNGERFDVTNPATGGRLTSVPDMDGIDAESAIFCAERALPEWSAHTAKERSIILRRWFELIEKHADALALLLSAEQGKPIAEAKGEVAYGASFVEWFAEEAKRAYGQTIPAVVSGTTLSVRKEPVGVCVMITPWNFPIAMITRKVAPALAAGCTTVVKPAEATPLCALALADLAEEAGIPAGVLNVITCSSGARVGDQLTKSKVVRKLSFTGSTAVGKHLIKACSSTVKRVSMELGGNAPFIVFNDANIDAAIDGALVSKYRNTGQTCVCANRFYVQASVYDEFACKLSKRVDSLRVGDALEGVVDQGPLINEAAVSKVETHISDALARGGVVVSGGNRHELGGTFFKPTVITNVPFDALIMREETFGPVAGLVKFEDETDVIALANATRVGLAAYVYTTSPRLIELVSTRLEYGMVGINTGLISNEVAPFGGIKESGLGREGSMYGIDEYLELKYICQGDL